jgi:hypothetical protein
VKSAGKEPHRERDLSQPMQSPRPCPKLQATEDLEQATAGVVMDGREEQAGRIDQAESAVRLEIAIFQSPLAVRRRMLTERPLCVVLVPSGCG